MKKGIQRLKDWSTEGLCLSFVGADVLRKFEFMSKNVSNDCSVRVYSSSCLNWPPALTNLYEKESQPIHVCLQQYVPFLTHNLKPCWGLKIMQLFPFFSPPIQYDGIINSYHANLILPLLLPTPPPDSQMHNQKHHYLVPRSSVLPANKFNFNVISGFQRGNDPRVFQ